MFPCVVNIATLSDTESPVRGISRWEISNSVYLKVDVAVLQPVGTSLIEEVEVFYEQAEERDDNLQGNRNRKGFNISEQI